MIVPAVHAEVVEPVSFGEAVDPALFRDFLLGVVLRRAHLHGFELGHGRASHRSVGRPVLFDERFQ